MLKRYRISFWQENPSKFYYKKKLFDGFEEYCIKKDISVNKLDEAVTPFVATCKGGHRTIKNYWYILNKFVKHVYRLKGYVTELERLPDEDKGYTIYILKRDGSYYLKQKGD